jgi:hypothetical protein
MHTLGLYFVIIGILGFFLGIGIHCYGWSKRDAGWLTAGQDTSGRAILIFIIGIFIILVTGK